MSRNVRRKSNPIPAKGTARKPSRSNSETSDSDDAYEGVDNIPDSSDDEPDVEAAEERHLIEQEKRALQRQRRFSGPSIDFTPRPFEDFPWDEPDVIPDSMFDEDAVESESANDAELEGMVFHAAVESSSDEEEGSSGATPTARRVRFDLSSNLSIQSEDDEEMFPPLETTLYLERNSLAPHFRHEIGYDSDNHSNSSFWDFAGDEYCTALGESPNEDDNADDESGSVGSSDETDDGDTTDDDEEITEIPAEKRVLPPSRTNRSVFAVMKKKSAGHATVSRRVNFQELVHGLTRVLNQ